ncbi:extracellular solute-binding protein [Lacticaseibacillus zhaodongensis]|uniref:extracellular solute-binding protein n=1 Tax=Lacticaseibacillus zhaodongensis TaxID=2668065 RepID=UPI0012D36727|nr:extracellular solute-binding protein [Lacticaseibacillus zhaodongensis]
MKLWKKIGLVSSSIIAVTLLAACGNSSSSSDTKSTSDKVAGNVKLWVDTTQVSYYKKIAKNFNKKYPDVKVKVTQSPNGSANAKTDVAKDPAKAADVFEVPNDQLGAMANQGYINPLSPAATAYVKKNNTAVSGKGVEWKNKLYGYPFAEQAQTLYYNKSKLSATDVKDWDALTSKGVIATDFTVPYNFYPIFLSAGTNLYGKDGETLKGTNVNNQMGVNAMTWFAQQKHNKGVMQTSNALNQLKSGKATAILDGPWDTANIKKVLGSNFGVAPYPTVTIGGKKVQMQAFLGIEAFAVNSHTDAKNQKAAASLAQFITNKQSQLIVYKHSGQIPVDKSAQKDSAVANDAAARAVMTMAKEGNSTVMPKMSQMATFWNLATPLINGAYTGSIKANEYPAKLQKFYDGISKAN